MIPLPLSLLAPVAALCASLSSGHALAASTAARQIPMDPVPPLLADDGSAFPSAYALAAAEGAAGGPAPGWATRAQRDQLQRAHPDRVVRLRAMGGDPNLQQAPAPQAWVFVEGDGEAAVRLARRLAVAGVERVWVMRPDPGAAPAQAPLAAQGARGSRP